MPNSATLVQALLAAFCAILCALSGMGGGGMMLGARTAAWAKYPDKIQWEDILVWEAKNYTSGYWVANGTDSSARKRWTLSNCVKDGNVIKTTNNDGTSRIYYDGYGNMSTSGILCIRVAIVGKFNLLNGGTIFDGSTTNTGTGTRLFAIGFNSNGRAKQNWKMNGNSSGSTFRDDNPPVVIPSFPATVEGEICGGVRPNGDGYSCFVTLNGKEISLGNIVSADQFSLGDIAGVNTTYRANIFRTPVSPSEDSYFSTGEIESIRVQKMKE